MSDKYEVLFSMKAKEDLKSIVSYIKNILKESIIAKKYAKIIKDEIKTLNYYPLSQWLFRSRGRIRQSWRETSCGYF